MEIERITEGLRLCKDGFCEDCPYKQYTINCRDHLIEDAFNLVVAQRKANHSIIRIEKEKRRKLWQKAINQFMDKLKTEWSYVPNLSIDGKEVVDMEDVEIVAKEMINHIKE